MAPELRPLEWARVTLLKMPGRIPLQTTGTDANGEFIFHFASCADCLVEASLNGKVVGSERINLSLGGPGHITILAEARNESKRREDKQAVVTVHELTIPAKARAAFLKGVRELNRNHSKESLVHFRKAIEAYRNYEEAYVQCGVAYYQLGQWHEAEEVLRRGVAISPANAKARALLGKVLLRQGKPGDAVVELGEAVNLDGDFWTAHADLGRALLQLGDAGGARREALQALELKPGNLETHILLNNALVAEGTYGEAVENLDQMLVLFADQPIAARLRNVREALVKRMAGGTQPVSPPSDPIEDR